MAGKTNKDSESTMIKLQIKYYIFLSFTFFFLMACKSEKSAGNIRFWHSFVVSTHPVIDTLINRYEKQNPGIKIKAQYIPTGDALIQKLISAYQSNTTPDIAWVHADFFDKLVESESIFSVHELFNTYNHLDSSVLDDIHPELLRPVTYNDILYAIPMEATTLALIYNKTLFRKAGINPENPPLDWNNLLEYTRRLTMDSNSDGRTDTYGFYVPVFPSSGPLNIWMVLQWTPFLWQAGGRIMDEENSAVKYNEESGVAALTLWKDLYSLMNFENFTVAHDLGFVSQKVAMILDGPWNLPKYRKIENFDWGIAALPAGPAQQATYLSGEYLVVFRNSKYPRLAFEFINWLIRPEIQADFSIKSGYLPVRKSVYQLENYKAYLERDIALKIFNEQIMIAKGRLPVKNFSMEINKHIAEAIESSIIGGIDPAIALNRSAKKSNLIVQNAKLIH